MKTLIIYNSIIEPLEFIVVEGDFSRFHGVRVNAVNGTGYEEEFCNFMFDENTGVRKHLGLWSEDIAMLENKNWDKVVVCTYLP